MPAGASEPAAGSHPRTEVAAGILLRADGALLLTTRPAGKPYAGYWEFPGGKIERRESVAAALRRELAEELGISVLAVQPWRVSEHDYAHARVRLHWCKVSAWQGELQMREGQSMAWQHWPPQCRPLLPGALPVLRWLAQERGQVFDAAAFGL